MRIKHTCRWALVPLLLACATTTRAQVGTVDPLPYPGWVPSDRVSPALSVTPAYDDSLRVWRYSYAVANGAEAAQDIFNISMRLNAPPTAAVAPAGWYRLLAPAGNYTAASPGVVLFEAELPEEPLTTNRWSPSAHQIPPGLSRSGFLVVSAYPPGSVRTYVQGFADKPFPPEEDSPEWESAHAEPADTTDAQRRWTFGPTRYTGVQTFGNLTNPLEPAAEGFLGFMNLAASGSVLGDPTPIALKLAARGETIYPETFKATLNGLDVTGLFHGGPPDGADLTAFLRVGSSPLLEGKNVLVTTIEGLLPGTTRRTHDEDMIQFDVRR